MRKTLSFVLALVMALTALIPASLAAFADPWDTEPIPLESYDLWVNGKRLTDANSNNPLGDNTVKYEASSHTLTLTGANLSECYTFSDENDMAVIYSALPELTVNLVGESTVKPANSDGNGIVTAPGCNLTINGTSGSASKGVLTIKDANFGANISCYGSGEYATDKGSLTLDNGACVNINDTTNHAIWVNHNINVLGGSELRVSRTSGTCDAIFLNTAATLTVTDSTLVVNNPGDAVQFGNGDTTEHAFVLNSGYVELNSEDAYGINIEGADTGAWMIRYLYFDVYINGGKLVINAGERAVFGCSTNLADNMIFTKGSSIVNDSNIVIEPKPEPEPEPIKTGWVKTDGKWYFYDSNGVLKKGWLKDGGKWYFLRSNGVMATGWVKSGGKWYYLSSSGAMLTGWQKIGGAWYFLNKSSGAMVTGWLKDGGKWYYLDTNGKMRTANLTYKGKVYKFNKSGVCLNP